MANSAPPPEGVNTPVAAEHSTEEAETGPQSPKPPNIIIYVEESAPPRPPHPCEVGHHRWAWLTNGRQACGYCGRPR